MHAVVLNCTLKPGPETSNTEALAREVCNALSEHGVESELIRVVDSNVATGVTSDEGEGDGWPEIRQKILAAEILILATPTWVGQPSSVAQKVVERLDAMLSETDDADRPVAYNRVGGIVVTGNEDGAHHIIGVLAQVLIDVGFTVPGQAWTYWNRGPGAGPSYLETDEKHDWSIKQARVAASNLVAVARALAATPIPPPPG
jgi:multimeric flavodoxin WrbA